MNGPTPGRQDKPHRPQADANLAECVAGIRLHGTGQVLSSGIVAGALRLLGFAPDRPVRVAAVRARLPLVQVATLLCPTRPVKAAPLADAGVILATSLGPTRNPAEVHAGIGAAARPTRTGTKPAPPSASQPPVTPSSSTTPGSVGPADLLRARLALTLWRLGSN